MTQISQLGLLTGQQSIQDAVDSIRNENNRLRNLEQLGIQQENQLEFQAQQFANNRTLEDERYANQRRDKDISLMTDVIGQITERLQTGAVDPETTAKLSLASLKMGSLLQAEGDITPQLMETLGEFALWFNKADVSIGERATQEFDSLQTAREQGNTLTGQAIKRGQMNLEQLGLLFDSDTAAQLATLNSITETVGVLAGLDVDSKTEAVKQLTEQGRIQSETSDGVIAALNSQNANTVALGESALAAGIAGNQAQVATIGRLLESQAKGAELGVELQQINVDFESDGTVQANRKSLLQSQTDLAKDQALVSAQTTDEKIAQAEALLEISQNDAAFSTDTLQSKTTLQNVVNDYQTAFNAAFDENGVADKAALAALAEYDGVIDYHVRQVKAATETAENQATTTGVAAEIAVDTQATTTAAVNSDNGQIVFKNEVDARYYERELANGVESQEIINKMNNRELDLFNATYDDKVSQSGFATDIAEIQAQIQSKYGIKIADEQWEQLQLTTKSLQTNLDRDNLALELEESQQEQLKELNSLQNELDGILTSANIQYYKDNPEILEQVVEGQIAKFIEAAQTLDSSVAATNSVNEATTATAGTLAQQQVDAGAAQVTIAQSRAQFSQSNEQAQNTINKAQATMSNIDAQVAEQYGLSTAAAQLQQLEANITRLEDANLYNAAIQKSSIDATNATNQMNQDIAELESLILNTDDASKARVVELQASIATNQGIIDTAISDTEAAIANNEAIVSQSNVAVADEQGAIQRNANATTISGNNVTQSNLETEFATEVQDGRVEAFELDLQRTRDLVTQSGIDTRLATYTEENLKKASDLNIKVLESDIAETDKNLWITAVTSGNPVAVREFRDSDAYQSLAADERNAFENTVKFAQASTLAIIEGSGNLDQLQNTIAQYANKEDVYPVVATSILDTYGSWDEFLGAGGIDQKRFTELRVALGGDFATRLKSQFDAIQLARQEEVEFGFIDANFTPDKLASLPADSEQLANSYVAYEDRLNRLYGGNISAVNRHMGMFRTLVDSRRTGIRNEAVETAFKQETDRITALARYNQAKADLLESSIKSQNSAIQSDNSDPNGYFFTNEDSNGNPTVYLRSSDLSGNGGAVTDIRLRDYRQQAIQSINDLIVEPEAYGGIDKKDAKRNAYLLGEMEFVSEYSQDYYILKQKKLDGFASFMVRSAEENRLNGDTGLSFEQVFNAATLGDKPPTAFLIGGNEVSLNYSNQSPEDKAELEKMWSRLMREDYNQPITDSDSGTFNQNRLAPPTGVGSGN